MISLLNVTKGFADSLALSDISFNIPKGEIFGLVGTNGSGKSTMLRLISGIYQPNAGNILIDEEDVWENPFVKEKIFFVSDDLYFLPNSSIKDTKEFYKEIYPRWSEKRYNALLKLFGLNEKKKIANFSKGMKRQSALIMAISSCPDYLILDEAFDGLDPVIRFKLRQLLSEIMYEEKTTVIISSHNLKELEDFCNYVALIDKGKLIMTCGVDDISTRFSKAQVAFKDNLEEFPKLDVRVIKASKIGSVFTVVCECSPDELIEKVHGIKPILCEVMPLSLEEIFIYEMEGVDYDFKEIFV